MCEVVGVGCWLGVGYVLVYPAMIPQNACVRHGLSSQRTGAPGRVTAPHKQRLRTPGKIILVEPLPATGKPRKLGGIDHELSERLV